MTRRASCATRFWVRELASGERGRKASEELTYSVGGVSHREFTTTKLAKGYSAPVTPTSHIEVDMVTGERVLLKQQEIVGGHDPSRYATERLFATAPDGTEVPISLVYLREAPAGAPPGPRPLRLDAYGSYGTNLDPAFSVLRLALIDRGVSFAIAHVRGGQELGRRWWEEGRLLKKWNTFTDFIACAEHLVNAGYTAPDRLVIRGGSAGGMLMGVVANVRPDLFKAVNAEVPSVDRINLLLRSLNAPFNREEFGDPYDPTEYRYLRTWSPYENVRVQAYPNILTTGGLNDSRVRYWSPTKWVAKLRELKTDDNLVLLKMEMGAGHFGVSGRYDAFRETAFIYAFFLMTLGMERVQPASVPTAVTPRAAKRPDVAPPAIRRGSSLVGAPGHRSVSDAGRRAADLA